MKVHIEAEMETDDMVQFFLSEILKKGITIPRENIAVEAYSEKKDEWVEVPKVRLRIR